MVRKKPFSESYKANKQRYKYYRQNQISLNSSFENLLAASFLNPETQEMRRFAEVTVR
jgi:hypothetical protein